MFWSPILDILLVNDMFGVWQECSAQPGLTLYTTVAQTEVGTLIQK